MQIQKSEEDEQLFEKENSSEVLVSMSNAKRYRSRRQRVSLTCSSVYA